MKPLTTELCSRLQEISETNLNSKNLTKAINTEIFPYGIAAMSQADLESLK